MKSATISYRVADFLAQHAPFSMMTQPDLLELASSGRVKFHETDEIIFESGSRRLPFIYIVQQGKVKQFRVADGDEELIDILGEGELLGLGVLLGSERYLYTVRTASDVIVYTIRSELFLQKVRLYPEALKYLSAYFTVRTAFPRNLVENSEFSDQARQQKLSSKDVWLSISLGELVAGMNQASAVDSQATIRETAEQLHLHDSDTLAVLDGGRFSGVVTAQRISGLVARESADFSQPVATIVDNSVPTLTADDSVATALETLLCLNARMLVVRQGRPPAESIYLLSENDLNLQCGHSPLRLQYRLSRADSVDRLNRLLSDVRQMIASGIEDISLMRWYSETGCTLADNALNRLVELATRGLATPLTLRAGDDFCWLQYGVAGRQELAVNELPSLILLCRDDLSSESMRRLDELCANMSALLQQMLPGLKTSVDVRTLTGLQIFYRKLIADPVGMLAYKHISMFDIRPLGTCPAMFETLTGSMRVSLQRDDGRFVALMANDAMAELPPLTFFHGRVIDKHGESLEHLDLRRTTLQPLVNIARVFALHRGLPGGISTVQRFRVCAEENQDDAPLFDEAADAFDAAFRLYYLNTHTRGDDDALLDPAVLTRYEQRVLKRIFQTILALLRRTAEVYSLVPRH